MNLPDRFPSFLGQILLVLGISFLCYGIAWIFFRSRLNGQSFFQFIGFASAKNLDKKFWLITLGMMFLAAINAYISMKLTASDGKVVLSARSPYGSILMQGMSILTVLHGIVYCFLQSGLGEEIFFRGLIGKRLVNILGFVRGNIAQAFVFWILHFLMYYVLTGKIFSIIQMVTLVWIFGSGLVFGYVKHRNNGQSLIPSWIVHSLANFTMFVTMAVLWVL